MCFSFYGLSDLVEVTNYKFSSGRTGLGSMFFIVCVTITYFPKRLLIFVAPDRGLESDLSSGELNSHKAAAGTET